MTTGYRDDLEAAAAQLQRLDDAHAERERRQRREELERRREEVRQGRNTSHAVVAYVALIGAFLAFRHAVTHPALHRDGPFMIVAVCLAIAAAYAGRSTWLTFQRARELTRLDADLLELDESPRVRIAPESLAEAHERIAEREREEEDLARSADARRSGQRKSAASP